MTRILDMAGPDITQHEIDIVVDAMKTGWNEKPYYYVEKFQNEFAEYHDRKFAIMTPNCTTAIHLLLTCLGIGNGDEVIAPECTWIASVAPVTTDVAIARACFTIGTFVFTSWKPHADNSAAVFSTFRCSLFLRCSALLKQ